MTEPLLVGASGSIWPANFTKLPDAKARFCLRAFDLPFSAMGLGASLDPWLTSLINRRPVRKALR